MSRSSLVLPVAKSEPPAGSVILLEGPTGTAYQRLFSTDRWHSTTQGISTGYTWAEIKQRASRAGAIPPLLLLDGEAAETATVTGQEVAGQLEIPADLDKPTAAQAKEISELVLATGAPVDPDSQHRTRAEAAGLLLTLRAYAVERGVERPQ